MYQQPHKLTTTPYSQQINTIQSLNHQVYHLPINQSIVALKSDLVEAVYPDGDIWKHAGFKAETVQLLPCDREIIKLTKTPFTETILLLMDAQNSSKQSEIVLNNGGLPILFDHTKKGNTTYYGCMAERMDTLYISENLLTDFATLISAFEDLGKMTRAFTPMGAQ